MLLLLLLPAIVLDKDLNKATCFCSLFPDWLRMIWVTYCGSYVTGDAGQLV